MRKHESTPRVLRKSRRVHSNTLSFTSRVLLDRSEFERKKEEAMAVFGEIEVRKEEKKEGVEEHKEIKEYFGYFFRRYYQVRPFLVIFIGVGG